jgi:hypothetical protein
LTWFRVDDGFADHPKTLGVSLAAIGLWTKAGAWSAKHLTNGSVPMAAVLALGGTKKLAAELVAAGLWVDAANGYAFHEWLNHQPSRDQVMTRRASTRERVTALRDRQILAGHSVANSVGNEACNAVTNTAPVPSRPVPSQDHLPSVGVGAAAPPKPKPRRWRRFPADFEPTEAHRELAQSLGVDLAAELPKLLDHEFADPKTDPAAVLRTWIRNAARFAPRPGLNGQQRPVRGAMAPVSKSFEKPDWDAIAAEVKAS